MTLLKGAILALLHGVCSTFIHFSRKAINDNNHLIIILFVQMKGRGCSNNSLLF